MLMNNLPSFCQVLMGHRVLTIRQYSKPGEYILQLACPDTIGRNVVKG